VSKEIRKSNLRETRWGLRRATGKCTTFENKYWGEGLSSREKRKPQRFGACKRVLVSPSMKSMWGVGKREKGVVRKDHVPLIDDFLDQQDQKKVGGGGGWDAALKKGGGNGEKKFWGGGNIIPTGRKRALSEVAGRGGSFRSFQRFELEKGRGGEKGSFVQHKKTVRAEKGKEVEIHHDCSL